MILSCRTYTLLYLKDWVLITVHSNVGINKIIPHPNVGYLNMEYRATERQKAGLQPLQRGDRL